MPSITITNSNVEQAYQAWAADPTPATRDAIVIAAQPMTSGEAIRRAKTLPRNIDPEDLEQIANIAVINAIDTYDSTRGMTFSSYARCKIRHAYQDHLRVIDHASRVTRRQQRAYRRTEEELRQAEGREPTPEEVLDHLDIPETRRRWWSKSNRINPATSMEQLLEQPSTADGTGIGAGQIEELKANVARLPKHLRHVIEQVYFNHRTHKQIAKTVNVSASTISIRYRQAISQLREMSSDAK